MLSPDHFFKKNAYYFPTKNREKARVAFRRAIRDYYVMQRKYVYEPNTRKRVSKVIYGAFIKAEKSQNRIVKRIFAGKKTAGRPTRPEIRRLISRLIILWEENASSKATLSWKIQTAIPTKFEEFIHNLLPRLGAPDVRRYLENHWKDRK
jgi:hypothetical protein